MASLQEFNRDAPRNQQLAWDLIRRARYWVADLATDTFGPSKFVGFAGMTFEGYRLAKEGKTSGDRFDGYHVRAATEATVGRSFQRSRTLDERLVRWAEATVGPQVFDRVSRKKWRYLQARSSCPPSSSFSHEWSTWATLDDHSLESVPDESGAYQIRAVDERGRPLTIRRCFGEDRDGILGIGESKTMGSRLRSFLRCIGDIEQGGHMAGWRFAYLQMGKIFPMLEFRYRHTLHKASAYELEGELLAAYVARHYELPPLNYKFNWSQWEKARAMSDD